MTHVRGKLIFAAVALTLGVGYLVFAGVRSSWVYYLDVDQFMTATDMAGKQVRLCGKVADEDVVVESAALHAGFKLNGKTHAVMVNYKGIVPDNFKAGVEVVVEGKLADDGTFHANVLLTKCASKYDEKHQGRIEETPS